MQAEIGKLLCEVRNNIMGFYKKIEEKQKTSDFHKKQRDGGEELDLL